MADSSQVRRILYMHPAHRTVGVSGIASSFRQDRPADRPDADELAAVPLRVLLLSHARDDRGHAALTAFERILAARGDMRCNRIDLAAAKAGDLFDADCVVAFGRGIQIVGRWSASDANAIEDAVFEEAEGFEIEVEIAAAARWHPAVEGVGPFVARKGFSCPPHIPANAAPLLVRRWAGRVYPVAWARQGNDRAFCTTLGHPDDFRRQAFVRLLLNAIEWVGR